MGKLVVLTLLGASLALIGERFLNFRGRFGSTREIEPKEPQHCHLIEGLGLHEESPIVPSAPATGTQENAQGSEGGSELTQLHLMNLLPQPVPRRILTTHITCWLISQENGSEDIDILPSGLAFISTGLKYPGMPNFAPDEEGKIFLMDLNEQNPKAQALKINDGFDKELLNPHGISTFVDKDRTVYLYVVNHPDMDSTVEIFKFEEEQRSLTHLKTITHELLKSLNDIVVVGPEQFYATRDHYFTSYFFMHLEMFMDLKWSHVLFYSPREVKVVAQGFSLANGITVSLDQKYVYVADPMAMNIHILKKHDNWNVTPEKVIQLETLVDNLNVDPDTGDILGGCHPNLAKLLAYNPEDPPGSEVLRIQDVLSDKPRVTTLYANNGSVLQASSAASVYHGKMLVGTVFHKALYCEL